MIIQEKLDQMRRDFTAIYECEYCGYTYIASGYDDEYFHQVVIPAMVCPECGKSSDGQQTSHPDVPAGVVL